MTTAPGMLDTITVVSPQDLLLESTAALECPRVGPVDHLPAEDILALLPTLPTWPGGAHQRTQRIDGAATILDWLLTHPGDGWQARWLAAGGDNSLDWVTEITAGDPRAAATKRQEVLKGFVCLLLRRVVLPSYEFLFAYKASTLFAQARQVFRPDLFAQVYEKAAARDTRNQAGEAPVGPRQDRAAHRTRPRPTHRRRHLPVPDLEHAPGQ